MKVAIIKYNAGNVVSVTNTLNRLGVEPTVTDNPEEIRRADKVIFPGVGEASTAMAYLRTHQLDQLIPALKQPTLGICLGLQLMCTYSEENDTKCLGIFDQKVLRFQHQMKIPQIGWNLIYDLKTPLFDRLPDHPYIYFVHSYYAEIGKDTIAISDYGNQFSAALHKDNFYAIQGHPEKSGQTGQRVIENFLNL